jgi:hypothetical protein
MASISHFSSTLTRDSRMPIFIFQSPCQSNKTLSTGKRKGRLFAPIFFFHGRQGQGGWFEADDFQVDPAVRADDNFSLNDIFQRDFSITFRTMGSNYDRHFIPPKSRLVKEKKPSGMEGFWLHLVRFDVLPSTEAHMSLIPLGLAARSSLGKKVSGSAHNFEHYSGFEAIVNRQNNYV